MTAASALVELHFKLVLAERQNGEACLLDQRPQCVLCVAGRCPWIMGVSGRLEGMQNSVYSVRPWPCLVDRRERNDV